MDLKFKDNNKLKLALFTQLEYIESTGTQYIDTGIKLNSQNIEVECKIQKTDGSLTIGNYGAVNDRFEVIIESSSATVLGSPKNIKFVDGITTNIISVKINYNNGTLQTIYNGNIQEVTGQNALNTNNNNIWIFRRNLNCNAQPGVYFKGRIYKFSVKLDDVLVINLIPALSGITPCMYDTVSKTFFYNQGTGDFIAGPVIKPGLPKTILLKTSSLFHKNTPNVDGLQLLNYILNYQKTHQDEIKEHYYPTTQLWQDIITEYPDIVQYYNMNHKLCVVICEADDPEQCSEYFLDAASDIQQELEEYPDLISIIAEYPASASLISENPSLIPVIIEWPPIIHSLIDTGYENVLIGNGNSWIDTGDMIDDNTNYEIKFNADNSNSGEIFGNGINGDVSSYAMLQLLDNNKYAIIFNYSEYNNNNYIANNGNHIFEIRTLNGVGKLIFDNNILTTNVSFPSQSYNSYLFGIKQSASNPANPFAGRIFYYKTTNNTNNVLKYLIPFYRNGHYGMIDLITLTFYPNAGSGEFTYSLEPKNA